MNESEFDQFINVLVNDCELIIYLDGIISTETVRENLREVMKHREKMRTRRNPDPNNSNFQLKNGTDTLRFLRKIK
jgi:hypothetical protein